MYVCRVSYDLFFLFVNQHCDLCACDVAGSRSTSPASRFDYITYKEPASESVVRRTSLSLTHGNSALHHTQNSSPLQISQGNSHSYNDKDKLISRERLKPLLRSIKV